MYFMTNLGKNQKGKGSTHDCSWGAPYVAVHDWLPRKPIDGGHDDASPQHVSHIVGDLGELTDVLFETEADESVNRHHGDGTEQNHSCERECLLHGFYLLQGAVLGGTLPQRSAGFWNSDDATNIVYMRLKVKRNAFGLF